MKFTKDKARRFEWRGLKGWAYNSREDFPSANATYFEVTGKHGRVKTRKSDRIYLVLKGKGIFEIDGIQSKVQENDVIIVPKNTPYDYWPSSNKIELFLVHTPAFSPEAEINLEGGVNE